MICSIVNVTVVVRESEIIEDTGEGDENSLASAPSSHAKSERAAERDAKTFLAIMSGRAQLDFKYVTSVDLLYSEYYIMLIAHSLLIGNSEILT